MQAKVKRTETKHRKVLIGMGFWFLSLTWGCLMTFIGLIGALVCIVMGKKPKRFHYLIYFELGRNWGGLNAGPIFFISEDCRDVRWHEAGHGIQNIMFGVFMPFVVSIPSCIRYWYRVWFINHISQMSDGGKRTLPDYDSIWFEGQATRLGNKYFGDLGE